MTTEQPIIELDQASFCYGQHVVVDDISLKIMPGEYVGIIGPNGGGKTTILKLMLGLIKPSAGHVLLFNQPSDKVQDRAQIGYVPQRVAEDDLHFPATVLEIVTSGRYAQLKLGQSLGPADRQAINRAIKTTNIAPLSHRLLSELSGGERQRVFLARALAAEPTILMLDEPTTGVDVQAQAQFYDFLRQLNQREHLTILFVSHELDVVGHEASSIICLNHKLICHTTPELAFTPKHLERLYGKHSTAVAHEPGHHHHA